MRTGTATRLTGRGLIVCLLVASVTLATGCGSRAGIDKSGHKSASKPLVLTLANHEQGPEDVQAWANAVHRLSNGTLLIRVANNWRREDLAYDRETITDVRAGRIALAKIAARAYDTVGVTSFQPFVAPFLIDSKSLENRVLRTDLAQHALAGTARLGLVGLALLPGALRIQVGVSHPMLAPSDFHGARIAVREGRVTAATYRALGAEPVELPAGSPLNSVDGAELSADILKDNPSVQRVRELTANVELWPRPITIVMNSKIFSSLTATQQNALRNAGRVAFTAEANAVAQREDDARRVICRIGIPFVQARPAQLTTLRAAVQPVYSQIERDPDNAHAIRAIEKLKRNTPADVAMCSSQGTVAASVASRSTSIDGTYRTSFSKQQLAHSHSLTDAGEINDENWGTLTIRFDHGRMTFTQRNARAAGTETGPYTVNGDTIRLEIDQTGERFAFRWNLYRDTLKFQRDESLGVGPTPFLVKPWQRVH